MSKKRITKGYKSLSEGSKVKLRQTLERLDKAGITVKQAKGMTDSNLSKAIGFKGKKTSFLGFKRNVNMLSQSQEHRRESVKKSVSKYKVAGVKASQLKQIQKDLTKVAGSSFISISDELQKLGYSKHDSYDQASFLLKIPKTKYSTIPKDQRDILRDFGT